MSISSSRTCSLFSSTSIAIFCYFDNHLASITSKKISNASMIILITEIKNSIILAHLVFFMGGGGDT